MTRQILPVPNPVPSYWLSDPHPLADHRSSPQLPETCDVAVVGAGMAGVLTAYRILQGSSTSGDATEAETGTRVLLVDARALCSGATGRNGGHVKVQVNTLLNLSGSATDRGRKRTAFQDYVARVITELKHIVEEEGIACEFELRRSFDVFTDPSDASTAYEKYTTARQNGEKWTENVSWIAKTHVEQVTGIKGAEGAFSVPAASFWPYKFVTGLLERMLDRWPHRLNVQMHTPITSLSPCPSGDTRLDTHRGAVSAAKLVLATNAYTAGLVPLFKNKIIPIRGMASHHRPREPVHPHLCNTYNINSGPGQGVDYLNPRPDGGIVVGGGACMFAKDEASWKDNIDDAHLFRPHVVSYWRAYMQTRFFGWEDSGSVDDFVWTGIMGRTGDGQPFVGRVPGERGVWVLAGFNGGGMALIALCARAVGRMVIEERGFGDLWREEGLLPEFECSEERLKSL